VIDMRMLRPDHVGVVVDDLDTTVDGLRNNGFDTVGEVCSVKEFRSVM